MLSVKSKIEDEYKIFEMLLLASSRENIYQKSSEIEARKQIVIEFSDISLTQEENCQLYPLENLLDYILLIKEEMNLDTQSAVSEIIRRVKRNS